MHQLDERGAPPVTWRRRPYARAEQLLAGSIEIDSASANYYTNILVTQVAQGKFEVAERTLERFSSRFPDHPAVGIGAAGLASARFDYITAEGHLLAPSPPSWGITRRR